MREEAFTRLRALYQDAKVLSEGGCELVHLSAIKITVGSELQSFAALLCPQSHSGYATRLFLDRPVPGKGANWRSFPLLGKTWWACSIRDITANQPLLSMLLAFLDHFK